MKSSAVPAAEIEVADNPQGSGSVWRLKGAWGAQTAVVAKRKLDSLEKGNSNAPLEIDLSAVERMDTAGAWLVRQAIGEREDAGGEVKLTDPQGRFSDLIEALPEKLREAAGTKAGKPSLFVRFFTPIGRNVAEVWNDTVAAMYILGSAVRGAQLKLGRRSGVSPAAIVNQIDQMGVKAVPIIMLMSFLIGAIIAQQGAFQLRYFGAEVFVVDLVGILQLREIGVLLTAIMIAGRSGSAITAEIGSMKMREEIDALKVMGLSPVGVLVFPRLVALTVALPLLTIIANFAALAGAAVVANAYSGITYDTFLSRLREAIDISTIVSGMIKAPFMALVIGIVASVEGLKVGGSAESLGLHVTTSVVKSIFVVILMDGLFAMFYAAIDF
ncbi:phospholipid/cholesterol/gamma-HCH transport system permease protein [Rhizobium subbaraonis]|uniref:Phospholipid/cholesterol/gamma-HCH transport system permease protein n=1 Tax=Rhizobium subbaraonis TaxID=908946 RepID=A0A285UQ01_9HYPH|nr:ABC transporter permease [Rhizobium subbaraonis]SOC42726.1 phospholipid/cholesterol/gamma-HCH transport system permease protein [Rhizobium subbaraonis]